jgi:alpha-D-ribose 1-methylphosphonate 5-triphosphate diphosphatase
MTALEKSTFVLSNARLVLEDRVPEPGWTSIADGRIAEIGEGGAPAGGLDLGGDFLIPGLVELHTDHLEPHVSPRPAVEWHPLSAVLAYDAQIAASGITTVFDSLRLGRDERKSVTADVSRRLGSVIDDAQNRGLLRADHKTHLRCEICSADVAASLEAYMQCLPVHLISVMDHTPGERQFRDVEKFLVYYRGKGGMTEAELQRFVEERHELFRKFSVPNRRALVSLAKEREIPLASHDDTTLAHVEESICDGVVIAEFPTTDEAAAASHAAGVAVLMGAPNLVRGGSHSGNVSTESLARRGTLDILSSDYVPASLIQAAFELPKRIPGISLPQALATVTTAPARAVGLDDRGMLEIGRRADLVHVHLSDAMPVVRRVWREGRRVV